MLDTKSWKISQPCLLSDQPRPPPPRGGLQSLAFLIIRTSLCLCFCQEKNLLLTNVCPFLHSFRIVQNRTVQSSFLLVLFQYLRSLLKVVSLRAPKQTRLCCLAIFTLWAEQSAGMCSIVTVTIFSRHGQYLMDGELRSNNFMCFCCNLIRLLPHFTSLCGEP